MTERCQKAGTGQSGVRRLGQDRAVSEGWDRTERCQKAGTGQSGVRRLGHDRAVSEGWDRTERCQNAGTGIKSKRHPQLLSQRGSTFLAETFSRQELLLFVV